MVRRSIDFPAKDRPLADDVRRLGEVVGGVIREQAGEPLFARVERARRAAIRRREGESGAGRELEEAVAGLEPAVASELLRAFSTYFGVVNIAEQVHRVRRRRDYLRADEIQPGSFRATLAQLAREGVSAAAALALLDTAEIEPVFTAHPTEAVRQTLLRKEKLVAAELMARFDPSRIPDEEAAAWARIAAAVASAWQTEEHPGERPTVAEEREHILFYLGGVVYDIVPPFYEALAAACGRTWDEAPAAARLPAVLHFASWVGADMDGNPNVTAATLEETLERHRQVVLTRYHAEVSELGRRLSQSASRVGHAATIGERLARYGALFPERLAAIRPRHRDMPYRVLARLMAARLEATAEDAEGGYAAAGELAADLRAIAASLAANRGAAAGGFRVERLLRRVETFGFHLATLDARQDAAVHRRVAGRLLGDGAWEELAPAARTERLAARLAADTAAGDLGNGSDSPESASTQGVFAAIGRARRRYGERAVGPFIVSMTEGADDVLTVLVLARRAGLEEGGAVPLDVAPLFETVDDLEAAGEIMDSLLSLPVYRRHLEARGNRQMVMIGYSDSAKDGGLVASRWALHRAQEELVAVHRRHEVALTLFHGRGGTVSRGGGKTHLAVLAAPPGAVDGGLRVTEQGEAIDHKYGLEAIALRTLERALGSLMVARGMPAPPAEPPAWRQMLELAAAAGRRAYRRLVYEDPVFPDYFRGATPIDVIERLRIGSRPATRRPGGGVASLRAIPWVFAWTQSRHLLPAWYGLGTGLAAARERYGAPALAEMISGWRFARTLVGDAAMVLAKADLEIAARYAELAGPAGKRLFPGIRDEFERTVEILLELGGSESLLEGDRSLARSIRLRNPYVDPMSLVQIDLLRRWRAAGRPEGELLEALFASVHGIARALRNTG